MTAHRTSAVLGTGTAIQARASTPKPTSTSISSRKSSTRDGAGASDFRPAGDRAVDALCRRPPRSSQGHPVRDTITSAHYDEDANRWTVKTDQRRDHRRAIPDHLLRDALGADEHPVPRPGHLQGTDLPHRAVAQRAGRLCRQARRRRRHRSDRHPGHPDHRKRGRASEGFRADAAIRPAHEEPEIRSGRRGGLQGAVRRAEEDASPHIHRLRVRLRAQMGRPDAGAAPRGAGDCLRETAR